MRQAGDPWRRPVGVVVIDVFAEGVVEVSPVGDEDAVGALAPGAGDPPLDVSWRAEPHPGSRLEERSDVVGRGVAPSRFTP
jgi:hypothetical protein